MSLGLADDISVLPRDAALSSTGLRRVLLMLQHCADSANRPTATDEKTRKVLSISVVIYLLGTISGKSL